MSQRVAAQLQNEFPALSTRFNPESTLDLGNQIFNHWRHLDKLKRKRTADPLPPIEGGVEFHNFNKRQRCGINPDRDIPLELPSGETKETQKEKKELMISKHRAGSCNSKEISKLMEATYVSQRATINKKVTLDKLLIEWPFFGRVRILILHLCDLTFSWINFKCSF